MALVGLASGGAGRGAVGNLYQRHVKDDGWHLGVNTGVTLSA